MGTSHQNDLMTTIPPIVSTKWLFILSGSMWNAVGVLLIHFAYGWLTVPGMEQPSLYALLGVGAAIIIFFILFFPVSKVNIKRLQTLPSRVNIFAFQAWYGYPLIIFMMSLGLALRYLSVIPKEYLAVLYIGIGGSIFAAGFNYYIHSNSNANGIGQEIMNE